jgi:hypothetical protein
MDIEVFVPFDRVPGLCEFVLGVCRSQDEREEIESSDGVMVRFEGCTYYPGFIGSYYEPEEPAGVEDFRQIVILFNDLEIVASAEIERKISAAVGDELDEAAVSAEFGSRI